MNRMLPPDDPARVSVQTLAEVVRYAPLQHLSTGLDGMAIAARSSASGELVELRHATVAQENPERWAAIDAIASAYALVEHRAFRKLLAREMIAGTPVLVLSGLPERELSARVGVGSLPPIDACALAMTLADALWHAHALGIVHGNLGPSAVLLDDDGAPLLDFPWLDVGRAQTALDRACHPPEREREALDMRSDVYALGVLLQILLLGRAPTPRDTFGAFAGLLAQMLTEEREARPNMLEVSRALSGIAGLLEERESDAITMSETQRISGGAELAEEIGKAPARALGPGTTLGRYELGAQLGRGGMGEVYRAIDRVSGEAVALKVLRADVSTDTGKLQRFRKEARILSELKSPYIARLIELNHDAGTDFLALELIEGEDLADLQRARGGRLPEREALAITADVCRGLAEAHSSGIVHRDIKPENVMIARSRDGGATARSVKLCDFGIARALDRRSGTLAFTQEDALLGTPEFMAPEQCNGETLSAATDVYALGVMLFGLIAGRPPFESKDVMSILLAHTNRLAPRLSDVIPEVSDATSQLVARMLEKRPFDRYADAAAVLEAIERILRGEPTQIAIHPVRPKADPKRVVQHVFEFDLASSPEPLWPFVSNTDRLNRAVGLPPALFERIALEGGVRGVRTQATNRIAGVDLRWEEHPFEWVEGRRWGVLRVFDRGVLHWFTVELELLAKPGGGTRLRYALTVEPKHWLGRLIVALEMRHKQRPALAKAFARIDAYASATAPAAPGIDAFEPAPAMTEVQRAALTAQLTTLRKQGVADDVLDALGAFCVNAPPQEVARLRPLALARSARLPPDRVVDACLRGAKEGLFQLLWEILCPLCRVPSGFADTLQALKDHGHCPSCNVDFQLDFTQSLELVFRVAERIRASDVRTFCVGGPAFAPHVVAQVRLAPGERLALELSLGAGMYKVRSPQLPHAVPVQITASAYAHRASVQLSKDPPGEGARVLLASNAQSLSLENMLDREIVARVERTAPREDALTAARAACMASFRRLFPSEVLAQGRLVAVGRTAFVVTRAVDQRRLMMELGDARAFEHMLALFDLLESVVSEEGGAVVKTASGVSLSAFASGSQALRAALVLRARLDGRARDPHLGASVLDIRIAVHEGAAVAATFDGKLDYFGQAIERAIELLDHAPASQLLVSAAVLQDHNVQLDTKAFGGDTRLIDTGDGFAMLVKLGRPS